MSNRYDDLVLHLNLDDIDISAGTTPDSSKSGLKAKVNGASLVEDDTFGACFEFQGQDDRVEVSSVNLTGTNPSHTIEGWIKVKAYPEKAKLFILLFGQADHNSHHWLLNTETGEDLGKKAQLGYWGGQGNHATPIIPLAEWVHLAATFDATSSGHNYVCYLNGEAIDVNKHYMRGYKFDLTDKRLTLAGSADLRKSAGVRGLVTEENFQGKMAHVRVYRRALSESEIREDIDTDKLALPAYRRGHPISFSLRDEDEHDVLYIGDNPRDHHRLKFELRNTSGQAIRFQKQGDQASSKDNYHFELVFSNGVLSDKTLELLRESKNEIVPKNREEKERWENLWDLSSPGEDSETGTVSVYFLYKGTSQLFGQNTKLVIPLRNISANAGSGARGARIELKLNQLTYDGETTPITGSQIQHLQIISHLGSRRVPLHVGFVGSNRILNDGSENTLVLQLMNVLKSEGDTSGTHTTLTSAFTMPAVNGTAVASVASGGAAQFNVGGIVYILPIGYLNVTAVNTASNQLTLQNLSGYSVNQPPGSVAPSGNTLLTKDSESSITLTQESEFLISFDVQSASEYAPWSLCTEHEINGVKGSIIVAKTDGRYIVIDRKGDAVSDDGRWKVDNIGHGQGETPVWSIKPRQDIVLGHDDYIQIYIRKIKTSLPSGLTNLYLDYRRIPGFWDGQVVCPIEKAPLLFYDVTAKGQNFSLSQRGRDYIQPRRVFNGIPLKHYLSSEERDDLVKRLNQERGDQERLRADALKTLKPSRPDTGNITWQESQLAEAENSLSQIAALLNEIETQRAQLQYTGEVRVGVGCIEPKAKLEIALGDKDADTNPLVIRRKGEVNYLTILKDGKVGIGTDEPSFPLHMPPGKALRIDGGKSATDTGNYFSFGGNGTFGVDAPNKPNGRFIVDNSGKVGIGTSSPGAKLSIKGGLHVGGESDPGDTNLLVDGKASIKGGLHVGSESDPSHTLIVGVPLFTGDSNLLVDGKASIKDSLKVGRQFGDEGDPFKGDILSSQLVVKGEGFFFGRLDVASQIRFMHHPAKHFVADINVASFLDSGNYYLVFRTWRDAKLHESVTVHPPGGKEPTLAVEGNISEKLEVIDAQNKGDWSKPGNPICDYFKTRLAGKPSGTTLRALWNKPDQQELYFEGWVNAAGDIMLSHNRNDIQVIVKKQNPTGGGGTVVYADR